MESPLAAEPTQRLSKKSAPPDREVLVGRYSLTSLIGRGGMAEVFEAYDRHLERIVAIKRPRADAPRDLTAFARMVLLPRMRQVTKDAAIEINAVNSVPAFVAARASKAVALALALTGATETHAVSYTTEAGLFEQAGCPAVICGPGDIAQAHAADEYVSLAQLDSCMAFLAGLAKELSA